MDQASLAVGADMHLHAKVPLILAHAGGQQVAHSGESGKCFRPATQGAAEPRNFGQPSRHHRSFGVDANAKAIAHAHCDGDNVFQRPAEFAANDIVVRINAKCAAT